MTTALRSRAVDRATREQQRAADPQNSVWVSASAGTGKTKVLTDRVLSLLLQGNPAHRLLCLTFTKAAAAEMATRIIRKLGEWATIPDAALVADIAKLTGRPVDVAERLRARRLFAAVLDAPGGLKIQTIHAFCQSLLARFPLEAAVAPHFTVMDEATAEELRREARESVLARTRAADLGGAVDPLLAGALATVTDHVQEIDFAKLLASLTFERGRLGRLLALHGGVEGLIAANAARLGLSLDETPDRVRDRMVALAAAIEGDLRRAAEVLTERGGKTDQECGARIRAFLAAADRLAGLDEYRRAFFTKTGELRRKLATKACVTAMPEILTVLEAEQDRLARLEDRLRTATLLSATVALLRLGTALLEAYDAAKQRRVALDYDDLILKTRDLLRADGGCSWVLFKLDGGLDHILIDEAQDTNPEQWEVIAALAEEFFVGQGAVERPRTIFAVGDAKQSIFSFQRADPAAFARMREHFRARVTLAKQEWREIPLDVSFRSTATVLRLVDSVFAQPSARDGVIGDEVMAHAVSREGDGGLVELWPLPPLPDPLPLLDWEPPLTRQPGQSPMMQAARLVARRIAELCRGGERLESRGRPISAGDILVLVRRRTGFVEALVRILKEQGIPVAGVDRMVLTDQLAVMDLIALGRFLLLPEDDLTLACLLKSPLVGLDEEALFRLAHGRTGSLWSALGQAAAAGDAACATAHARLADLLAQADFMPPFELFSLVLTSQGGRERLLARLGEEANDPIDEFLAQCLVYERGHPPTLEGFLHWLEKGELEVKRDSDVGARAEVRIMTVHGAKGLQAPIVILADTMSKPQETPRLLWPEDVDQEGAWGPLWVPRSRHADGLARRLMQDVQRQSDREYRRLLYVALTRAEDRLYVLGWPSRKPEPADCWYRLVEAGIAALADAGAERVTVDFERHVGGWRGEGWRLVGAQQAEARSGAVPARAVEPASDLPAWVRAPAPAEPTPGRPLAPSQPGEAPPVRSPLDGDDESRFRRGTLIHRLLQTLPELPVDRRAAAGRRFLADARHGLGDDAQAALLAETLRVMDDPAFAAVFAPGSRAEVPLVGRLGEVVVSGQIDRLAVTPGRVLIVDYKTNRPPPRRVEDVAPVYLGQLATYRALIRRIYPDRPVEAALLWTDIPALMPVPAALLDDHAPSGAPAD